MWLMIRGQARDLRDVRIKNAKTRMLAAGARRVPDSAIFRYADFGHVRDLGRWIVRERFGFGIKVDDRSALPGIAEPDLPVYALEVVGLRNLLGDLPLGELARG